MFIVTWAAANLLPFGALRQQLFANVRINNHIKYTGIYFISFINWPSKMF